MLYTADILSKKIEEAIEKISFEQQPKTLYEPIHYILALGGKRVRPLLTLLSSNLFNDDVESSLKPAIGIEIFHNFSLLHDDLMDKSDMRRGVPTVHKKWDPNTAILSGDAMLIASYKYISDVPSDKLPQILDLFSNTAMQVCQGQQFDMDFEKRTDVSESEYIEMIRLKTAVLLACSLKIGAIMADATEIDTELLYSFGINIGLAFQLKDDLLDVYGDSKTFGKKIGGDIINNKKTFLLIKALELSNKNQQKELLKWITAEKFENTQKIEAVRNIYDELKLKSISENLIKKYYLSALKSLSTVNTTEDRKREIMSLTQNLMYREK